MYIDKEVIQSILNKIDIVDVIGQYVQLEKRGQNYVASCPFHEDNNPSFSVSQPKQIYKCFSCGRGGNVFGFLQEIEGISFQEAVIKASSYTDQALSAAQFEIENKVSKAHQELYDIHKKAAEFYHYYLCETVNGEEALNYLKQRQLSQETLAYFQIGLAPDNSAVLREYLLNEGFKANTLVESGIFYANEQGDLIDRFHNRLIIPLTDEQGRLNAFSGRILQEETQAAKYLNSPQTEIFDKSNTLFNFHGARGAIRKEQHVILAEGYMDVMALHEAGFPQTVATMGTALTEQHVRQLQKATSNFIFAFDGDRAGQEATLRAFKIAIEKPNLSLKAILIPQRMDPDDWIKHYGTDSFRQLLHHALTYYEYYREFLKGTYDLNNPTEQARYVEELLSVIALIQSPIERQLRTQDLANTFQLEEQILTEEVERSHQRLLHKKKQTPIIEKDQPVPSLILESESFDIQSNRAFQSEKVFLFSLIYEQPAWDYIEKLDKPIFLLNKISQEAYLKLQAFYYESGQPLPLNGILDTIENIQLNRFFSSLIWEKELLPFDQQIMEDCLKVIEQEFVCLEIEELTEQLKTYQLKQDNQAMTDTLLKIHHLTRQIKL